MKDPTAEALRLVSTSIPKLMKEHRRKYTDKQSPGICPKCKEEMNYRFPDSAPDMCPVETFCVWCPKCGWRGVEVFVFVGHFDAKSPYWDV